MVTKLKLYNPSENDIVSSWHVIDATGQTLGRLATNAAMLIMGKHKPTYVAHMAVGDFVVITNAEKIRVSGKKANDKVYVSHNQQPGHLKRVSYRTRFEAHPDRVIQHAVEGMLPKNKLGDRLITRLKVYKGPEHPHAAQIIGSQRAAEKPVETPAQKSAAKAAARKETASVAVAAAPETAKPIVRRPRAPGAKPVAAKKTSETKPTTRKPATKKS